MDITIVSLDINVFIFSIQSNIRLLKYCTTLNRDISLTVRKDIEKNKVLKNLPIILFLF